MDLLSKGDFARHIGVTPGRVSQMISSGMIGADALAGEGRSARVVVAKAVEQIRRRRDVGQSLGNGLLTRLDATPAEASAEGLAAAIKPPDDTAEKIQLQRLEEMQRRNRLAAIEEQRQLGELVSADDMRREVAKAVQDVLSVFIGMTPDLANAIAAKFGLSQRDVLFELRRVMAEKRAEASAARRDAAEQLPATVEAEVELS
jgi:hypothetical protein